MAWWRTMRPAGAMLRVAVAWSGDDLVGIVPLMRVRTGWMDELVGLAPGMAVRGVALAAPGSEAVVAALVARALAGETPPHRVRLEQVDLRDPFPGLLAAAWPGAMRPVVEHGEPSPVPTLVMAGQDYDGWLASKSGNFRQRTRREGRRMEARGATMRIAEDREDLQWALGEFHRLHASKWADRSALASDAGLGMMRAAAEALGPERMRVHVIEADGAAVSVQVFVTAGGELIYWNGGWNPDWAQHSPAHVGIVAALEDGFARGDLRLDLGEDDSYDYKTRIANGSDPVWRVLLYPRGPRYVQALALTAPQRARRTARGLVGRLPEGVSARLRRLARRDAGTGT